jgi:formylglycine-generating enzyme required for sulfatase activity
VARPRGVFLAWVLSLMTLPGVTLGQGNDSRCAHEPGDAPEMVTIDGEEFEMGSASLLAREKPVRLVKIARPFAIGRCEVTVAEFTQFVALTAYITDAERPGRRCYSYHADTHVFRFEGHRDWRSQGFPQTEHDPVTCVSWNDARAYVEWLNRRFEGAERRYRLPSESEWEYAARSGTVTERHWPMDLQYEFAKGGGVSLRDAVVVDVTVFSDCLDGEVFTAPAASFRSNRWGLYDTSGNVWEWAAECWHESYAGAPVDGSAWTADGGTFNRRSWRGRGCTDRPVDLSQANRLSCPQGNVLNDFGFRVARIL